MGGNSVIAGLYKSTDGGATWEDSSEGLFPNTDRPTLGDVISLVGYRGTPSTFYMGTDLFFCEDAFITKLNPDGSDVVWSTYFGGSGGDVGSALALDASGNVYVVGYTSSSDLGLRPEEYRLPTAA